MTKFFFAILPLMVCSMWTLHFLLDYILKRSIVTLRLLQFSFTAVVLYAGHAVFFMHANSLIPVSDTLYGMANLAVYPMYLLYIVQLTKGQIQFRHLLTLLPSLLCGLIYGILYYYMDEMEIHDFIEHHLYHETFLGLSHSGLILAWMHQFFKLVFLCNVLLIGWLGFKHLRHFEERVAQAYADTEGRTLRPVHSMLWVFIIATFLSTASVVVGRQFFQGSVTLLAIPSTVFSILLYVVCYIGSKSMFSYAEYQAEQQADEQAHPIEHLETEAEIATRIKQIAEQIGHLMTDEKYYLKPDLRIGLVARELGTNSKYVSMAFNQVIGEPFADYVNRRRIAHAKELQQQQPNLTNTEIARNSGYESMQSFYRNIKKWG